MKKSTFFAILTFFSLTFVKAANLTVTTLSDAGFRGVLEQALVTPEADTITFAQGLTGVVPLNAALPPLTNNITIIGPGPDKIAIARAVAANFRIFDIYGGVDVTLYGLTIANGQTFDQDFNFLYEGGAGIRVTDSRLTIINCEIKNNTILNNMQVAAGNQGGGISAYGATNIIINSTIISNAVAGGQSSIPNNPNDGMGAGIFQDGGIFLMTNCTVSGNHAQSSTLMNATARGGGIFLMGNVQGSIVNSTIAFNRTTVNAGGSQAGSGGGGIYHFASMANIFIKNTLISDNNSSAGTFGIDVLDGGGAGNIISLGNNLVSRTNSSGIVTQPGDQFGNLAVPLDAMLVAVLTNNGGETLTHALLPGSPAIDAGSSTGAPTTDQRFYLRTNTPDIGAFEFNAAPSLPVPPDNPNLFLQGVTFEKLIPKEGKKRNYKASKGFLVKGRAITTNTLVAGFSYVIVGTNQTTPVPLALKDLKKKKMVIGKKFKAKGVGIGVPAGQTAFKVVFAVGNGGTNAYATNNIAISKIK